MCVSTLIHRNHSLIPIPLRHLLYVIMEIRMFLERMYLFSSLIFRP